MLKAFLSHTNVEKDFVTQVASRLKRSSVIFDVYNFEAGMDFRTSIREGLDNTDLYVLFASQRALQSIWVQFELDEAEIRFIEGKIKNVLVFTIGNDISHKDLPVWLKRALVIAAPGPAQVSRIIQEKLLKENQVNEQLFIGREDDLKSFSEKISEYGMEFPQVIAFTGLEGVGRRTFAEFALRQNLLLKLGPIFQYDMSSGLEDIYFDLLNENTENISKLAISESIAIFNKLSKSEKAQEIARLLALFTKYNYTPVIVDKGSFQNEQGNYIESFVEVLNCLKDFPDSSLVIIQTRHPYLASIPIQRKLVLAYRVKPLSLENTTRMLHLYLRNAGVIATNPQIQETAAYLEGFPPSVLYATAYAKEYGMDSLIADKTLLTDFKVRAFTEFLEKMELGDEQKEILRLLAVIPAVTLSVLAVIVNKAAEEIVSVTRFLVDTSLIIVNQSYFSIAIPIRDAVWRKWGSLSQIEFSQLASRIKENFWDTDKLPDLDTISLLVFALLRAKRDKELTEFAELIMPSTLMQATRAAYDSRDWKRAKDLAVQVLKLDYERDDARVILYKSLVRENEDSEVILAQLEERQHKSVFYLSGFRALKNGDFRLAARFYHNAIRSGDESNSVYRELAECQYWLNDLDGAKKSISVVLERNKRGNPNPFVLDLAAKIFTDLGEYDTAEEYIARQQLVDRAENVAHRKSALFLAKGLTSEALAYADEACMRIPALPEIFLHRVRVLIENGLLLEADKALDEFNHQFKGLKLNIQLGLRCKVLIAKSDWKEAEIVYERLFNKGAPVNKGIRVLILRIKIRDKNISITSRQEAQQELLRLEQQRTTELFDSKLDFEPILFDDELN